MITRLGGGWSEREGLAPDAMERTLFALARMAETVRASGATAVRVVGTQALRVSCNGQEFAGRVRAETGFPLEIITGGEEAELSARGVLAALHPSPERHLIFDIGGGSTEFIYWHQGRILFSNSYPLGVVSLAEQYGGVEEQVQHIQAILDQLTCDLNASLGPGGLGEDRPCLFVGTAGTVTTLAAMDLGMVDYDWRRINNHVLHHHRLQGMLEALLPMPVSEREKVPGIEQGRGDLIVPGLQVVLSVLHHFGSDRLHVSDFGLLEGALMSLADPPK